VASHLSFSSKLCFFLECEETEGPHINPRAILFVYKEKDCAVRVRVPLIPKTYRDSGCSATNIGDELSFPLSQIFLVSIAHNDQGLPPTCSARSVLLVYIFS
jgi:hypothetical protein